MAGVKDGACARCRCRRRNRRSVFIQKCTLNNNPPQLAQARRRGAGPFWTYLGPSPMSNRSRATPSSRCRCKPEGGTPGDATAAQMMQSQVPTALRSRRNPRRPRAESRAAASHRHNRFSGFVARAGMRITTANVGLVPLRYHLLRLDYCSLANARSIPIAQEIARGFRKLDLQRDLGGLGIDCINACGHHHVGHMGGLGVEKNGEEFYAAAARPMRSRVWRADRPRGALRASGRCRGRRRHRLPGAARANELFIETVKRTGIEVSGSASMPLVENGRVVEDRYVLAADGPIPARVR